MALLMPKESPERVGIENPASPGLPNGDVWPKVTKGIDVQYESGVSTIRISGTPVMKRKQIFEQKAQSQSDSLNKRDLARNGSTKSKVSDTGTILQNGKVIKQNPDQVSDGKTGEDEANYGVSASIEITSDVGQNPTGVKDINDNDTNKREDSTNGVTTNSILRRSSKKVSFLETVAINKDTSTTLAGSDEDDCKDEVDSSRSVQGESEVINTEPVLSVASKQQQPGDAVHHTALLPHTCYREEVEVIYTDSTITEVAKPHASSLPVSNGDVTTATTPIVDEYEVRQLSRKLSSKKERNGGPTTPPSSSPDQSSSNVNKRKQKIEVKNGRKDSGKYKKKLKSNRVCMWLAVVVIVVAVAGLMILGILYAISTTGESVEEVRATLASKLSLTESNAVFTEGRQSPVSASGLTYSLVASGDRMTWRKPSISVRFSWHRGTTVKIHSLPFSEGKLSTFQLGDLIDDTGLSYSELLTPDYWYAGEVEGEESYCLLSAFYTDNGNTTWDEADQQSLLDLYPQYGSLIRDYF